MKAKKYFWYRTLFNGYEPNNTIRIKAELIGDEYVAYGLLGFPCFSDGSSMVKIQRNDDGSFNWQNDDKSGIASTWAEAWENLPALITKPDHFEDSEIIEL